MVPELDAGDRLDPALACFVLVSRFLGTPADPRQIIHDRGKGEEPFSLEDLARVARRLDLVGKIRRSDAKGIGKLPLPAIAELTDGNTVVFLLTTRHCAVHQSRSVISNFAAFRLRSAKEKGWGEYRDRGGARAPPPRWRWPAHRCSAAARPIRIPVSQLPQALPIRRCGC